MTILINDVTKNDVLSPGEGTTYASSGGFMEEIMLTGPVATISIQRELLMMVPHSCFGFCSVSQELRRCAGVGDDAPGMKLLCFPKRLRKLIVARKRAYKSSQLGKARATVPDAQIGAK